MSNKFQTAWKSTLIYTRLWLKREEKGDNFKWDLRFEIAFNWSLNEKGCSKKLLIIFCK